MNPTWAPVVVSEGDAEICAVGGRSTNSVKLWLACDPALVAVIVIGKLPWLDVEGEPANVAVPFPLSARVTPEGSVPLAVKDETGNPWLVTVKEPGLPAMKVVLALEVTAGASWTVSVNDCVADGTAPFDAVSVSG